MTLFQGTAGDPRDDAQRLSDVLRLYGAAGDLASGNPAGLAERKADIATSLARAADIEGSDLDALYFATLLHAVGAIGNAGLRKGEPLPQRLALMARWDVPAESARICARIAALPAATADIARWSFENWDGTGFPDQLRWNGIPKLAQIARVADIAARAADPDEALALISAGSAREIGPEYVQAFTMWFHRNRGEASIATPPVAALHAPQTSAEMLLDEIADRIDAHCEFGGRWHRVAELALGIARELTLTAEQRSALAIAARLFGAGAIGVDVATEERFDPLARLGINERMQSGARAAALFDKNATLKSGADVVHARSEWFDGTGKPNGLAREAIPIEARVLSAAIAFESLERSYRTQLREERVAPLMRLETAVGTQFDPRVAQALAVVAGMHAA